MTWCSAFLSNLQKQAKKYDAWSASRFCLIQPCLSPITHLIPRKLACYAESWRRYCVMCKQHTWAANFLCALPYKRANYLLLSSIFPPSLPCLASPQMDIQMDTYPTLMETVPRRLQTDSEREPFMSVQNQMRAREPLSKPYR